jgi:hypothetical protein
VTRAWHFASADMRLGYGDGREIVAGETLTVDGRPSLCERGLHASVRLIDAIEYAPENPRLCRVEVGGEIATGADKIAGTERTCEWALSREQTDAVLREFACRVAEQALERAGVTDPRCHEATDAERAAAWAAAWAAAGAAARAAAWDAAWAAAWDAAGAAARAAAWDAAWAAAWDAAWAAARAAAWDAAWAAAWAAQNALLEQLATEMHERGVL